MVNPSIQQDGTDILVTVLGNLDPNPTPMIVMSFLFHWTVFFFIPIPSSMIPPASPSRASKKFHFDAIRRNCLTSTAHCLIALSGVIIWLCFFTPTAPSDYRRGLGGGVSGTGDEYQYLLVAFSTGYFIYDTLAILLYPETFSTSGLLHHLSVGTAFILGVYTGVGRSFHFFFLLEELSTPFLNLKSLYKHNQAFHTAFSLAFAITFLICRDIIGNYIYYVAVSQLPHYAFVTYQTNHRFLALMGVYQFIMCSASRFLNIYWSYLIIRKLIQAATGTGNPLHEDNYNTRSHDERNGDIEDINGETEKLTSADPVSGEGSMKLLEFDQAVESKEKGSYGKVILPTSLPRRKRSQKTDAAIVRQS